MAVTLTGHSIYLADEAVDSLRSRLRGDVLTEADPDYDEARTVWNGMIDRKPAVIARCRGTSDVVDSVSFAREHDLLLSVRGGGHNVAGSAVCEGGLMIDLSEMTGITVDPISHRAWVQAGATWGDVDRETQLHGLITPGGQISTTGVAGLTLGGGIGNVRRKWGLSADNLVSAELVTANGEVIRASEDENPDLFWGIRGGGGNFGVVTVFEFQLHELGPRVYAPAPVFSFEEAPQVLRAWKEFIKDEPREVSSELIFWSLPAIPDLPEEMHGVPVIIFFAMYAGDPEEGQKVLQPMVEAGTPLLDLGGVADYVSVQSDLDPLLPAGDLYYWKALMFDESTEEVENWILDFAANRPTESTMLIYQRLGGAIADVPEDATAYSNRSSNFNFVFHSHWEDPARSDDIISRTRAAWRELRDLTGGGGYVNFGGFLEDSQETAQAAYQEKLERLRELKRRHDPDNVFRMNVNIRP